MYPHTNGCNKNQGTALTVAWGNNSIQWFASGDAYQMNESGKKYYYVAVGFV